jgi:hypothetical protein
MEELNMKWISVKDELPDSYDTVLIAGKDWVDMGEWMPQWGYGDGAFADTSHCALSEQPTHWMKLPDPPDMG